MDNATGADWTVESLTALLRGAGGAPGWDGMRPLFVAAPPLPPSTRPGAPEHPRTDCLLWQGPDSGTKPPYGRVRINNKYRATHRVVFELAIGSIELGPGRSINRDARDDPIGSTRQRPALGSIHHPDLAHLCERSLCCRPDHVRPLTRAEHGREAANRRWPDELLALAPPRSCRLCEGPTTVSATVPKIGRPRWMYVCPPCSAAWHRGRRRGVSGPTGIQSLPMDDEIGRRFVA